jgi:hypothetical protein
MTTPRDRFWDELGVAWCAINPEIGVIMPRLQSRLRRQSALIMASLILGLPLSLAGFVLGVYTIWNGGTTGTWNFVTRGVALVAISAILSMAMSSLLRVRADGHARALSEMLDLAIARAERTLFAIQLGFYACGIAASLGLVGAAMRTHLTRPPALSPMLDLAALAIFAVGLFLYGRRTRAELAKFRYLKRALAVEGEGE